MDVIATKTTIGHKVLSVFVAIVLVLGLSPAVPATNQVAWADDLTDGTYTVEGLSTAVLSMYHFDSDSARVVIKGDDAWLITGIDGAAEAKTLDRFDGLAYGPQSEILDPSDETNHTLVDGATVADVVETYDDGGAVATRTFVLPVPKSVFAENADIYYMIKYRDGFSDKHDGDWYKASGGDYYLTGYTLQKESDATALPHQEGVELAITNNTNMFKVETADAFTYEDGSATLTMTLSGTGYQHLILGTYEDAVAEGDNVDSWLAGNLNADGKWEFQVPFASDEMDTVVPIVAVSKKYYDGYVAGSNPIARAFYPRQMTLSLEEGTLVTGDFESSEALMLTNNVKMFTVGGATLDTIGGPNSNGYKKNLVLTMGSESYTKAFVGTPQEAEEATEDKIATLGEGNTFDLTMLWMEKAGDPESTVALWTDGEPFVTSFWSAKNEKWYGRQATLDTEAGTLVFDPWIDPAPANTVDEKIAKIQSQTFTDTTYADCEDAKAAWDALSDDEKKLVEEYDYFGLDTGDASKDDPLNQDKIGEKEILVVSFGTSFNDNRVATIGGIEKAIKEAYPEWSVRRAFTAQIIINHIYARDGEKIDNMKQALDRAVANGVKELVISPTHLMKGAEFDELVKELEPYKDKMNIRIAEPLLGEVGKDANEVNDDKLAVAKAVVEKAAAPADTALVLMGHGTAHDASISYEQMQTAMNQLGYGNVFVGTVEGEPEGTDCASIIAKVKEAGFSKVILRPLMVVAGDHANNDMADPEDEESWFSQFVADEAFSEDTVTCQIAGLGEIAAVQQIYVEHIADVLGQWKRLRGNNQYDTMQQVSAEGWASASAVILATGENFPDALSAAGAAGFEGAPVLITETSGKKLSAQAAAELKRLAPKKIIAVGGKYAMPQEVVDAAMAAAGTTEYVRLKGSKASGTAAEINKAYKDKWGDTAFLATSLNFPDALSAAPLAYSKHIPIFLVDDMDTVSEETVAAMKECGIKKVIPLGGKYCVSATAKATLSGLGFEVADALKGATAYETAKAIAEYGMAQGMTANKMGVACGQNFPDALTGAALCGKNNAVLVLADGKDSGTSLPIATANKDKIGYGYVFGGKFAVPQEVMDAFEKASL